MSQDNQVQENDRKKIERSAAYPSFTIEQSVEFSRQVKKAFLKAVVSREEMSAVFGKSDVKREVSTAVQYGLLEKLSGEGYRITQLAEHIFEPISPEEKIDNCAECFKKPKLYGELIEKYRGHTLPADEQLRVILSRQHGITSAAAPQAIEIFLENALYVGLLNQQRVLMPTVSTELAVRSKIDPVGSGKVTEPNSSVSAANTTHHAEHAPSNILESNTKGGEHKQYFLLDDLKGYIKITIPLSSKKTAFLTYPESINTKDIKILSMQIDQLALTIDEE